MQIKICFYECVIVSETTVLEGGSGCPPPEKTLVIFVRNGGILGNTNGYICLDIMPRQEGRLTISETYFYFNRDSQYTN